MFKGRLGIWILVLVIAFAATFFYTHIPIWAEKTEVTAYVDVTEDKDFDSFLTSFKLKKHLLVKSENMNSDIIFSDNIEEKEGYEKINGALYSPIVAFVSANVQKYPEGFVRPSSDSTIRQVDLKSILEGVEEGLTWDKLGVNTKVVKETVILTIPNESSEYYDDVVELFYLTLNNGKILTDEDRENLRPRVEYILNKCNKVVSILDAILSEHEKPSVNGKFFIAPEFLYKRLGNSVDYKQHNNCFLPVYFLTNHSLEASIFLKESYDGERVSLNFYNILKEDDGNEIFRRTGWRVKGNPLTYTSILMKSVLMKSVY